MSITNELRKWWVRKFPVMDKELHGEFTAIADRIDAEHAKAIASVMNDALYHANEKDMAEFGWVRLPVDADGEYIHIGDVMYDCNESPSERFSVATMELCKWGWSLIDDYGERNEPSQCRHHHAPTVEDVLTEMLEKAVGYSDAHTTVALNAIAEYAAKLQLREDA